jgi:hypothetical protein
MNEGNEQDSTFLLSPSIARFFGLQFHEEKKWRQKRMNLGIADK